MAAQLEIKQQQVFAARGPLIELIYDHRNKEEQQEALEELLSTVSITLVMQMNQRAIVLVLLVIANMKLHIIGFLN